MMHGAYNVKLKKKKLLAYLLSSLKANCFVCHHGDIYYNHTFVVTPIRMTIDNVLYQLSKVQYIGKQSLVVVK